MPGIRPGLRGTQLGLSRNSPLAPSWDVLPNSGPVFFFAEGQNHYENRFSIMCCCEFAWNVLPYFSSGICYSHSSLIAKCSWEDIWSSPVFRFCARLGEWVLPGTCLVVWGVWGYVFVATFTVARLTSRTRKLWLVEVATDRNARYLSPARM